MCGTSWNRRTTPEADAAPSDPFRSAVESMVCMLENGEWAEHVAEAIANGDELASRLETEITELHNDIGEPRAATASGGAQEACAMCNGHGMIGGPYYYAPDEGGEPCPDCAAPLPREAATENEALSLLRGWYEANAKGTVMVEDAAYRLVAETAALLAAATNGEQA